MKTQRGFTLAEMAIVVLLISIAMTMGLKMVTAKLENAAYSETKSKQEQIKIALIGYLRTNKKLPCPDYSNNDAAVATGAETSPCTADAKAGYGVIPWQTLGISRDTAKDGWGNYFTYRVANGVGMKNWTSTAIDPTTFDINEFTTSNTALTITDGTTPASTTAVVVILSHGKNGFGAKTVKVAARIPTAGAGTYEITNATNTTTSFVLRAVTDNPAATTDVYDDLVVYMNPQDLLQPLISEGLLRACYAYCVSSRAYSTCSVHSETCLPCAAVGDPGVAGTCSGTCGTCAFPATASCSATGIPIGNPSITCL